MNTHPRLPSYSRGIHVYIATHPLALPSASILYTHAYHPSYYQYSGHTDTHLWLPSYLHQLRFLIELLTPKNTDARPSPPVLGLSPPSPRVSSLLCPGFPLPPPPPPPFRGGWPLRRSFALPPCLGGSLSPFLCAPLGSPRVPHATPFPVLSLVLFAILPASSGRAASPAFGFRPFLFFGGCLPAPGAWLSVLRFAPLRFVVAPPRTPVSTLRTHTSFASLSASLPGFTSLTHLHSSVSVCACRVLSFIPPFPFPRTTPAIALVL